MKEKDEVPLNKTSALDASCCIRPTPEPGPSGEGKGPCAHRHAQPLLRGFIYQLVHYRKGKISFQLGPKVLGPGYWSTGWPAGRSVGPAEAGGRLSVLPARTLPTRRRAARDRAGAGRVSCSLLLF